MTEEVHTGGSMVFRYGKKKLTEKEEKELRDKWKLEKALKRRRERKGRNLTLSEVERERYLFYRHQQEEAEREAREEYEEQQRSSQYESERMRYEDGNITYRPQWRDKLVDVLNDLMVPIGFILFALIAIYLAVTQP